MLLKIKNRIDRELKNYIQNIDRSYSLSKISPLLYSNIKEFVSREGKRVRPILFIIGYLGYSRKIPFGLYRTALSLELLHDFMLVHDDIIDKSDTRRGKPSIHAMLNRELKGYKNIKFTGEDLAIVIGDVIYAMAIHSFLSIRENPQRKEAALKKFAEAAFYTGSGEFIELLAGLKGIDEITKEEIYKIYDLKTSNYTFAAPLSIGAVLAGAGNKEIRKLYDFGVYLGRAFQIKDDILGMFSSYKEIGKSTLTDLQESKKTILIWHAYHNTNAKNKSAIKRIFSQYTANRNDLLKMCKIMTESGTLDFAKNEISRLLNIALAVNASTKMSAKYKNFISDYSREILKVSI